MFPLSVSKWAGFGNIGVKRLKFGFIFHPGSFFNYDILAYMKILLDEIMKHRNLTERQVSILTGLSPSTVHEIRKGSMPRVDTLEALAKGLKVKISDLIESEYL